MTFSEMVWLSYEQNVQNDGHLYLRGFFPVFTLQHLPMLTHNRCQLSEFVFLVCCYAQSIYVNGKVINPGKI